MSFDTQNTALYIALLTVSLVTASWRPIYAADDHATQVLPFAVATWVEKHENQFFIMQSESRKLSGEDQTLLWTKPKPVHQSKHALYSSSMVTMPSEKQILFWIENTPTAQKIRYKEKYPNDAEWSSIQEFYDKGSENIGINFARHNESIWSFWANTSNKLPDIKYSIYKDGRWNDPSLLHPQNSVPDLHPIAHFTEDGDLVVNWINYSILESSYVTAEKKLSLDLDLSSETDIIDVSAFKAPDFLPQNQSITIRFPQNRFKQSMVISSFLAPQ